MQQHEWKTFRLQPCQKGFIRYLSLDVQKNCSRIFFWLCCCKDRGTYWGLLLTLHFKFEGEVVPWLALGAGGASSLSAYVGFLRVLWLPQ